MFLFFIILATLSRFCLQNATASSIREPLTYEQRSFAQFEDMTLTL